MKKFLLPAVLLLAYPVFSQKQKTTDVADKYAQTITTTGLKEKLTVIAGADMEGRETASMGQRKAAAYIEGLFTKFGLRPGTTGGYQMQFPIYQDTLIEATMKVNGYEQEFDQSFSLNITSAANGSIDVKEVVYIAYGIVNDSRNDYEDLDVKGKWVMVLEGSPSSPNEPEDKRSPYSTASKLEKAKSLGAKGIFVVSNDFPRKKTDETKGAMTLKKAATSSVGVISVSNKLGHIMLNMDPEHLLQNLKIIPTGSYNVNVHLTISKRTLMLQSSNVLAVLPGTDKKDEYIVISAHYDHLGKRGNNIYHGADDDGSGTAAVLQLAEAFSKASSEGWAPRRSIVFMTFSGEEKGLLGSEFYADYPSYPLDKTSVNLNIDMIGRSDPKYTGDTLNYLYIIGDDKLSSELRLITDSINNRYTKFEFDRRYNNPQEPSRFFYRSDHYNFAKKGVPIIFYFNGTHYDYHKPTDTVDKINFDLMSKRTKLIFYTAWDMANRKEMLKRDIPLKMPN